MKNILSILLITASTSFFAQAQNVGINTTGATPDASAMLDIDATDKGLLIPRLSLTATNVAAPVTSPTTSLLVYNDATAGSGTTAVTPGYYYWNGTEWERIINYSQIAGFVNNVINHLTNDADMVIGNEYNTSVTVSGGNLNITDGGGTLSVPVSSLSGDDWTTTGNAGTTPGTNFVGTTDNSAFSITTNSVEKLRVETNGTLTPKNIGGSVFIGAFAGVNDDLSTNQNVFVGDNSGSSNTTGAGNVFLGVGSGSVNTTGDYNLFLGYGSGQGNTTGGNNIFLGVAAGQNSDGGNRNVAIGTSALQENSVNDNIAIGTSALADNTTGTPNIAIGQSALTTNTTGGSNTAVGPFALQFNTSGEANVAIGLQSSLNNTTGINNVAVGLSSLNSNTIGSENVALGRNTLFNMTSGDQNVAIGFQANYTVGSITRTNSVAIGYNSQADNNEVHLGNASHIEIGGYQNWTNLSDGRFKTNVQPNVIGLDFILKLQPVTYNVDVAKLNTHIGVNNEEFTEEQIESAEAIVHSGFIAQDVEKAADEVGYDFSGVVKPQNSDDHYGLTYSDFVVPTIKSIQELYELIKAQEEQIKLLEDKITKLESN